MYIDYVDRIKSLAGKNSTIETIGKSYLGRDIFAAYVKGRANGCDIIIQGAIHAREYVTAELVFRQLEYFLSTYGDDFCGGIYFVPIVNIDGVLLAKHGLKSVNNPYVADRLFVINDSSADFSLWKANANAVDLNTNFDARWGQGVSNITKPAPENYIGQYPNSETETQALVNLTCRINPALTLSYHAKGREIYWQFFQDPQDCERDYRIAERLARTTRYELVGDRGSAGGYKDWCISKFKIPSFTLEIIDDQKNHPIPTQEVESEWEQNKDIPYICSEIAQKCLRQNP